MTRAPLDEAVVRGLAGASWQRLDLVTETGSTNADLLARAAAGEDIGGAVLMAEHQTAGRGRHGRQWSAPPRSQLVLSVGVDVADIPAHTWGWLPLATGVAVIDALGETAALKARLKWPNDVLAGPADAPGKLAGILAEVAAPKPTVIIGLGLNVVMTADETPNPAASSLSMLGVADIDRNALAGSVLGHLAARFDSWRAANGTDPVLARDYRSCSATLGTAVRALLPGDTTLEGTAVDVDELGRLVIETGDGELVTVSAGDITHLRPLDP